MMVYSQIPLGLWRESYNNDFIIGASNTEAVNITINMESNILISGPRSCGKKHLAFRIANKTEKIYLYILNKMNDAEIIAAYDAMPEKAIWIAGHELEFSKDVESRLNAMHQAKISELTEDMLIPLLQLRLKNIGVMKNEIINYCVARMPRTYEAMDQCVKFIERQNHIKMANFRQFLEEWQS